MKQDTKDLLNFVDKEFANSVISPDSWKEYIHRLPTIYQNDISFRVLFDWHIDLSLKNGKAGIYRSGIDMKEPIFWKQVELINGIGKGVHGMDYQYRELILFHARTNLRSKIILEIGGAVPNSVLFDELMIAQYINIESPDYRAINTPKYSELYPPDDRRTTFFCNAENISNEVQNESIDAIFSVACFEHIYDLTGALESCHRCLKKGGALYSYFADIYSLIDDGDHGVIPSHELLTQKPIGLHLLSLKDQRKKLIELGITDPIDIQNFLGNVNFNRIPNRYLYEDYEQILTESPFWVLEMERQDNFNISKKYPDEVKDIRSSNPSIGNLMTGSFRTLLLKV